LLEEDEEEEDEEEDEGEEEEGEEKEEGLILTDRETSFLRSQGRVYGGLYCSTLNDKLSYITPFSSKASSSMALCLAISASVAIPVNSFTATTSAGISRREIAEDFGTGAEMASYP